MDINLSVAGIAKRCARKPWPVLAVALAISLLSLGATLHLPVYTSRQALLPQNTPVAERFNSFLKKFGAASDLIVVLENAPREELEAYAGELAARLRAEPEVGQATERLDLRFFLEHAYLMTPPARLEQFRSTLNTAGKDAPDDTRSLDASLQKALRWIEAPPPLADADLGQAEESLETLALFLAEWRRWLSAEQPPGGLDWSPFLARYKAEGMADGYFTSRDGRMLFLFAHARNPSEEFRDLAPFVERVKAVAADLSAKAGAAGRHPPTVGLTGLPAIEYEEYVAVRKDIALVISSAAVAIALLILLVVRSLRWALAIFVPMGAGALWSLALTLFTVGHLTIITSSFLAILFGLGADYGIFTSSAIAEQRRAGKPLAEAIGTGIGSSFRAVLTAGGASVVIFGALATVEFPGFAELGRVAAGGVLLILVSTWMVQPALYALLPPRLKEKVYVASPAQEPRVGANSFAPDAQKSANKFAPTTADSVPSDPGEPFDAGKALRPLRKREGEKPPPLPDPTVSPTRRGAFPRPVVALPVLLAITCAVAGAVRGSAIPFDYDVLSLLPRDSEAARLQRRMVAESDYQAEVVIFTAGNLAEARRIAINAAKLQSIAKVQSLTDLFPPDAEDRAEKARAIGDSAATGGQAGKLAALNRSGLPEKTFGLLRSLLARGLRPIDDFQEQAFSAGHTRLVEGLEKVRRHIEALRAEVDRDIGRGRERSELFFRALLGAAGQGLAMVDTWRTAEPLAPDRLPPGLRDRFFAADGTIAVYAFPAQSVYDPANLDRLMKDVYSISPNATGFPTTHQVFAKSVVESFAQGTSLAVAAGLIWLGLVLRRFRGFVLASLPLLIGGGWMLGIMALTGIRYNYANIIALPLVMALAVDYGVWFSHRWRELAGHSPLQVSLDAGKVIVLAAGTELAGLGAITLASYRGVSSMGVDITIGLLCCLPATLLVAPAIGQLIDPRRNP